MFPAPSNNRDWCSWKRKNRGINIVDAFCEFSHIYFFLLLFFAVTTENATSPDHSFALSLFSSFFFRNERRRSCKKSIVSRWLNNLSRSASQIFYPSILFFLLSWLPFTLVDFFLLLPVTESSSATSFLSLSFAVHFIALYYFLLFPFILFYPRKSIVNSCVKKEE